MRRVVVTGYGLVTPLGCGGYNIWQHLICGQTGISSIVVDGVDHISVGAKVPKGPDMKDGFDEMKIFGRRMGKELALFTQYAMYASDLALASTQLSKANIDSNRSGVCISSGIGAIDDIIEGQVSFQSGYKKLSPYFVPKVLSNMAAGHISIRHGLKGPNHSVATACAAGGHAIGDAFNWIRLGYADMMLCGGSESCMNSLSFAGFSRMKALSTCNDPSKASRPFDTNRDGFVMGEGAAVLVLEELTGAQARNANIIAEVVGYGVSSDAYHISSPSLDGDGARRAMLSALQDCKGDLTLQDIHYINAHATSTPVGDVVEAMAIESVFGPTCQSLYVSSTKGATGHLLGAAGAMEAAFTALAVKDGVIPPTLNLSDPDPRTRLSFKHVPKNAILVPEMQYAMSNSFGFGGTNACLIFRKFVL